MTGDERYAYVARETLDFVAHELRQPPGGAFAASLDADTGGVEGATYVWTRARGPRHPRRGGGRPLRGRLRRHRRPGNWEGRTILRRVRDDTSLAVEFERPRDDVAEALTRARVRLLRHRDERPPAGSRRQGPDEPGTASPSRAFADAGRILGEAPFVEMAAEAADFVLDASCGLLTVACCAPGRTAGRSTPACSRTTRTSPTACWPCTRPPSTSAGSSLPATSPTLILARFSAPDGGFHDTADDAEPLVARPRGLQDNALPSGGAMATLVLLRLAALTGEGRYRDAAERALAPMAAIAAQHPTGFAQWLLALQLASDADRSRSPSSATLRQRTPRPSSRAARRAQRPGQVMAVSPSPDDSAIPLLHERTRIDGAATAYVCRGFACQRPVTDPPASPPSSAAAPGLG